MNGRCIENIGRVVQAERERMVAGHFHRQIELRAVRRARKRRDLHARQIQFGGGLFAVVEQHLKQRRMTRGALRLQTLDEPRERYAGVGLGIEYMLAYLGKQGLEGLRAACLHADDERVHEKADQRLGFKTVPSRFGHADADIALAAASAEQETEGGEHRHETRDALRLRECIERLRERRIEAAFECSAGAGAWATPYTIDGQFEHRMFFAERGLPVRVLRFQRRIARVLALPCGVVAVLNRQCFGWRHLMT
ncbi:hypothetical protein YK56LOC_36150 [Caballeronia sp. HLA56]